MKFSQFLLIENNDDKEDLHIAFKDLSRYMKDVDMDTAFDVIKKNCSFSRYVYRGFDTSRYDTKDFFIIDSSKGLRTSKNTTNYYTSILDHIMDNDPEYKSFPKRSRSLICTSSKNTAAMYGDAYVILPFKDVTLGSVNDDDIWRKYVTIGNFTYKIHEWNDIFDAAGLPDTYSDLIRSIEVRVSDTVQSYRDHIETTYHDDHSDDDDYDEDYEADIDAIKDYIQNSFTITTKVSAESIVDEIQEYSDDFVNALLVTIFGDDSDKVESIIKSAYSPDELGFELLGTSQLKALTNNDDVEVWFSGKAVAVRLKIWDKIKHLL